MNFIQNTVRLSSSRLIRNVYPHQQLRSLQSGSLSLRQFSTESAPPTNHSSTKPLFQPSSDLTYGRLQGISKNTLKTDILSFLEECNLSINDLRVEYNPSFLPIAMFVQFPSGRAYDAALRAVSGKGRLYRLDKINRANWDRLQPYGGKSVLLQGVPPNAILEDIERFLSGCEYDSTNLRLFFRNGPGGPTRMALVNFHSPTAAMNATMTKNRGFCLNSQISMQVLQ